MTKTTQTKAPRRGIRAVSGARKIKNEDDTVTLTCAAIVQEAEASGDPATRITISGADGSMVVHTDGAPPRAYKVVKDAEGQVEGYTLDHERVDVNDVAFRFGTTN